MIECDKYKCIRNNVRWNTNVSISISISMNYESMFQNWLINWISRRSMWFYKKLFIFYIWWLHIQKWQKSQFVFFFVAIFAIRIFVSEQYLNVASSWMLFNECHALWNIENVHLIFKPCLFSIKICHSYDHTIFFDNSHSYVSKKNPLAL